MHGDVFVNQMLLVIGLFPSVNICRLRNVFFTCQVPFDHGVVGLGSFSGPINLSMHLSHGG